MQTLAELNADRAEIMAWMIVLEDDDPEQYAEELARYQDRLFEVELQISLYERFAGRWHNLPGGIAAAVRDGDRLDIIHESTTTEQE